MAVLAREARNRQVSERKAEPLLIRRDAKVRDDGGFGNHEA